MPLPTISQASFEVTIPSTGKKSLYRRFLISEEKILLIAKQSEDRREIARAVYQIINNCTVEGPSAGELTTFDFDYVFLKLRAQSVDNFVEIKYWDPADEDYVAIKVDLDEVAAPVVSEVSPVVNLNESGLKMKLKYPTSDQMLDIIDHLEDDGMYAEHLIGKCISSVYDDEEVYTPDTPEELLQWVSTLPRSCYYSIQSFLDAMPELNHVVKYTNKKKEEQEVVLRGIYDFFTF